jgi:hypothetical protein
MSLLTAFALLIAQPETTDLAGTWDVALYFSENSPPSATVMVIESTENEELKGTFYNSPFIEGRVRAFQDGVIFTVMTQDNSGPYLTSGRLGEDGTITGQTLSVGRDFLMGWTATRRDGD